MGQGPLHATTWRCLGLLRWEVSSWFCTGQAGLSRRGGAAVAEPACLPTVTRRNTFGISEHISSPSAQCFISNVCQFWLEFPSRIEQ